jgi:Domain of unknown function (DUF222)
MTSTTDDTTTRTGSAAADPFEGCLSSVGTALAGVADTPVWMLSEDAVQARLTQALRIRARVEELTARLLGSVVAREVPRVAGASSARAWLMATHGMSVQDAARLVRETALHSVDEMTPARSEPTRAAWAAGEVSAEQAVLIANAVDRLSDDVPEHAVESLQADLVGHAQTLSYVQLQHVCRHAVEVVDPGGADAALAARLEAEEARALQLCELRLRPATLMVRSPPHHLLGRRRPHRPGQRLPTLPVPPPPGPRQHRLADPEGPDGVPEVIPPERLDPTRQPRRHERLTRRQC